MFRVRTCARRSDRSHKSEALHDIAAQVRTGAKILIDYLRNNRTNTSVAAFSTRARPNAPISVPLDWGELSPELKFDHYTVNNLSERLRRLKSDPWKDYWI